MDTEDLTKEEQCENLMNIVVESRKRFGKMCIDYNQKSSLMENKMLNLQLETISNYRFKSKNPLPNVDVEEMCKDIDGFASEIVEKKNLVDKLKKKVKDNKEIVLQLKQDNVGRKVHHPVTAESMLANAKAKLAKETKDDVVIEL
ncbi:uncharacterized protein LOC126379009 [Pectinophora gossypiella]|uniref:uncharacterized protein LOC126379009 n=1 Tax=Pectinophora gossypiella TaxID=13191 RepID=UPI00214EDDDD|nr:uncharacterized protein LOC126379009 [Pectinophora gossypiella]